MNDLVRLMFDDGATRYPSTTKHMAKICGRAVLWWVLDVNENTPIIPRYGFHLHAASAFQDSMFHLNTFTKDPQRLLDRYTNMPSAVLDKRCFDGLLAFICLEYV